MENRNNFYFRNDEGFTPSFQVLKEGAGFTLIETLVAVFAFSIIAVLTTGIFFRAVQIQRGAINAQRVVENGLFLLEAMSRDIRVSQICQAGSDCSDTRLDINHPIKGDITYFLDSASGTVRKIEGGTTVNLTSPNVNFTRFNFLTRGLGISDNRQPSVTIVASAQNIVGRIEKIELQTTITTRDVSDEFQN